MKSPIARRSIVIDGQKTSVTLEEAFWNGMKEISRTTGKPVSELASEIAHNGPYRNLSSAMRLFVLNHFRALAGQPG